MYQLKVTANHISNDSTEIDEIKIYTVEAEESLPKGKNLRKKSQHWMLVQYAVLYYPLQVAKPWSQGRQTDN